MVCEADTPRKKGSGLSEDGLAQLKRQWRGFIRRRWEVEDATVTRLEAARDELVSFYWYFQ